MNNTVNIEYPANINSLKLIAQFKHLKLLNMLSCCYYDAITVSWVQAR